MKTKILLVIAFGCLVFATTRTVSVLSAGSRWRVEESKVQPKEIMLDKNSRDPKYKEVAFNHETHSTLKYSADGASVMACTECHHTDQPAAGLKSPLKTGERKDVLTTAVLTAPDAAGVKNCRSCHLQNGEDPVAPLVIPAITYGDDADPTEIRNDVAYHKNCNGCHDAAIGKRPTLKCAEPFPCAKGTIPGGKQCYACHKGP